MFIIFPDPPLPLTQNHYLSLPFSQPDAFFLILSPPCDIENQLYKRDFRYGRKNNKMLIHKKPHLVYVVKYKVLKKDEKNAALYINSQPTQRMNPTQARKTFFRESRKEKGKNVALLHNISSHVLSLCGGTIWLEKVLMSYWILKFIQKKILNLILLSLRNY